MQEFDLPLVAATSSVDNAIRTAIDAKRSGVVLKTKSGKLHLLHYKNLVRAARNKTPISKVEYTTILHVGRKKRVEVQVSTVKSAGLKFGYQGVTGDTASLVSVRETFAKPYLNSSTGSRCTRPGKPANTPDRCWYHYYPPKRRSPNRPDRCRECGTKII